VRNNAVSGYAHNKKIKSLTSFAGTHTRRAASPLCPTCLRPLLESYKYKGFMRYLLLVLFNLISFYTFADAERSRLGCFEEPFMQSGNNQAMHFIEDDFKSYFSWEVETEAPPLDITQATIIVKHWFQSKNQNMKLSIEEISLKAYDCVVNGEFKRMRVYMFLLSNPRNIVGLTMQGRVIELQPMK